MISIHIDDTIVDIVDKIDKETKDTIILDFPLWHPVLHNYISLKVLKNKAKNKKLLISTNDKIGKRIGKEIGIEYTNLKNNTFIETSQTINIIKHNYSFFEYLKLQLRSYKQEIFNFFDAQKKINSLWKYSRQQHEKVPVRFFMFTLLIFTWIFLFIYFFAISKTYVYIVPEKTVKKEALNFVLQENTWNSILENNNIIETRKISKTIISSDTFAATDILENNVRAAWRITIFNLLPSTQDLVPNTRFSTPSWIIYRIQKWVQVPAWVEDNFWIITPGSIQAQVVADIYDSKWKFVWASGNIWVGQSLNIPALDVKTQEVLYAESSSEFKWWSDQVQKIVSEDDIIRAKELFTKKMKSEALSAITSDIRKENQINNERRDVLLLWNSIEYDNINIKALNVSPWDIKNNFNLSGNITVYVHTYNKDRILSKLKSNKNERILQWVEKLEFTDESSLRMSQLISLEKSPFRVKGTFEVESIYVHDFSNKDNQLLELLKSEIRGLNKEEAEAFLLNNRKISNVQIEIRPFFAKNVSNIYNNIIFSLE